jgi:hypothetical protein
MKKPGPSCNRSSRLWVRSNIASTSVIPWKNVDYQPGISTTKHTKDTKVFRLFRGLKKVLLHRPTQQADSCDARATGAWVSRSPRVSPTASAPTTPFGRYATSHAISQSGVILTFSFPVIGVSRGPKAPRKGAKSRGLEDLRKITVLTDAALAFHGFLPAGSGLDSASSSARYFPHMAGFEWVPWPLVWSLIGIRI